MAQSIAITGTAFTPIGRAGNISPAVLAFEVTSPSTLAMDVQMQMEGSGSTPADCTYTNVLTAPRTFITAGTDITAAGVYAVLCPPGAVVGLKASAGSCTVWPVIGEGTL